MNLQDHAAGQALTMLAWLLKGHTSVLLSTVNPNYQPDTSDTAREAKCRTAAPELPSPSLQSIMTGHVLTDYALMEHFDNLDDGSLGTASCV